VDIFQPCVSFNKINTFKWFKENTYYLEDDYNSSDRIVAFSKSLEEEPFPLGILYQSNHRTTFEDNLDVYKKDKSPLYMRSLDAKMILEEISSMV
jgi:2-oxoglutarate ferredoxin oxidoreductase subunit beta